MAPFPVLKLPRSDADGCLLVQASSAGPEPLDLKLVATEGAAPYVSSLRHSRVASLRSQRCPVSEQEWEQILGAVLRREQVDHVEVLASVPSGGPVTITIRKQVKGITQPLGVIKFHHNQDLRIELFPWCTQSLDDLADKTEAVASLVAQTQSLDAEVAGLRAQLETLMQAKKEDETALLLKFRDLLNEKKVKIREQQKIISSFSQQGYRPAESGAKKRKAASVKSEEQSHDDKQAMQADADLRMIHSDADTDDGTASPASEDDADDAESEGAINHLSVSPAQSKGLPDGAAASSKRAAQAPPPPRALPFKAGKAAAPPSAGEETESDDEL
ncbi:hypothetical protein CDD80_5534 [Ophiocordyceps camponoti-rufipedis]|uniref:Uncharacterized protein n=1 Tax=Ophiocordyceps camponoti-rufipedis TaxID=2004952 RepID=A0A2C5YTL0_9HYPO|nr:hypothetical protein CDD80_5534 [Ophiocordyceps camponoti-rufipedis]